MTAAFDRKRAQEFLLARGAAQRPHPGGTLHEHLLRVAELLAAWGADQHLQAAGLCHACYGTDGYDQPLLALAERPVLAALVGRIVTPSEPDVSAFTELTAANELDILRHHPAMAAQHGAALVLLITCARARLTDAAWQAWSQFRGD
jgi:hypothetical protein